MTHDTLQTKHLTTCLNSIFNPSQFFGSSAHLVFTDCLCTPLLWCTIIDACNLTKPTLFWSSNTDLLFVSTVNIYTRTRTISVAGPTHWVRINKILTRLPSRELTLEGRWIRTPFDLPRVQPIYLSVSRLSEV